MFTSVSEDWKERIAKIEDPDLRSCTMIGLFISSYNDLEGAIAICLTDALMLEVLQSEMIFANTDFSSKLKILRSVSHGVHFRYTEKRKAIDKKLKQIEKLMEIRNKIAHTSLISNEDGFILMEVSARSKLNVKFSNYDIDKIIALCVELNELTEFVSELDLLLIDDS